jgi:hypothetical protein
MATKGALDIYINALPQEIRYPIRSALYYLSDNWRIGDGVRAENAQLYPIESTTASVANTEFAVKHGIGAIPARFIPMIRLNEVGNQLVPLQVSRAPDATYCYFKSSSTSAVFSGLLEV